MLYFDLITQIKKEGRIESDDSFDAVIVGLLNELFKEAVESQHPFELKAETQLVLTNSTETVSLPSDFFLHDQIVFQDEDTGREWKLSDQDDANQPAPRGMYGHPKTYEILSTQLSIKPASEIISGDKILLIYYKTPPTVLLTTLNTQNPIPRLEPFLIRAAIRRIRMFHSDDMQVAQMFQGDIASAGKGYSNDEPKETQSTKK